MGDSPDRHTASPPTASEAGRKNSAETERLGQRVRAAPRARSALTGARHARSARGHRDIVSGSWASSKQRPKASSPIDATQCKKPRRPTERGKLRIVAFNRGHSLCEASRRARVNPADGGLLDQRVPMRIARGRIEVGQAIVQFGPVPAAANASRSAINRLATSDSTGAWRSDGLGRPGRR